MLCLLSPIKEAPHAFDAVSLYESEPLNDDFTYEISSTLVSLVKDNSFWNFIVRASNEIESASKAICAWEWKIEVSIKRQH